MNEQDKWFAEQQREMDERNIEWKIRRAEQDADWEALAPARDVVMIEAFGQDEWIPWSRDAYELEAVRERREQWTRWHGLTLLEGGCAHRLLSLDRSGSCSCRGDCDALDHARIWRTRRGEKFLLSHPYGVRHRGMNELIAYTEKFELEVSIGGRRVGDNWYHPWAVPIEMWREA